MRDGAEKSNINRQSFNWLHFDAMRSMPTKWYEQQSLLLPPLQLREEINQ